MFTREEIMSLNELESFICNYIREHMEEVTEMTIRQLASEAHVSTTAILRVCKKFGCNGFSEFKIKLRIYIDNVNVIREKSDKVIFMEFMDMLEKDKYKELFNRSAKLILEKKHLLFLGKGMSHITANYGNNYFMGTCKFSMLIDDLNCLKPYGVLRDSITIVLSVSGESDELLSKVEEIRKDGGSIISITNRNNCRLAKISDINIPYYSEYSLTDNFTQIMPMYIIEKLAKNYLKLRENKL